MARHIHGPLYYERMGREGSPMLFVHPNPMDQSCWIFQMARFSTWYRCMAIDIPGYGRSPTGEPGLSTADMAEACWEAMDEALPGEAAVLVGCSVGALIVACMASQRPERTSALVMCGIGYDVDLVKDVMKSRIEAYLERGIEYRSEYALGILGASFRETPLARYFANLFAERNELADLRTILYQLESHQRPEEDYGYFERLACPSLILTGSEDGAHPSAFTLKSRMTDCELEVLPGAGHACHMEQPWLFDRLMIEFLRRRGLFPNRPEPRDTAA